jgi:regulator of replication initiation timing
MKTITQAIQELKTPLGMLNSASNKIDLMNEQLKTLRHSNAGLVGENNKLRNRIKELELIIKKIANVSQINAKR